MNLNEKTTLPLSIVGSAGIVLVMVVLWLTSIQSIASEANRKAEEAQKRIEALEDGQKQTLIMFGEINKSIGELNGQNSKRR